MKKALLSLAALSTFGFANAVHAEKVDICVFDLLGKTKKILLHNNLNCTVFNIE
jgi:hypothetical protein